MVNVYLPAIHQHKGYCSQGPINLLRFMKFLKEAMSSFFVSIKDVVCS
jgi:hypothetical protein